MDGEQLHEVATRTAAGLPATVETQPFGEGAIVHKVVGKMFVMVTEVRGVPIVNLKCAPPHEPPWCENTPRSPPAGT